MNAITHVEPNNAKESELRDIQRSFRGVEILHRGEVDRSQKIQHETGVEWRDGFNSGFAPLDDYDKETLAYIFA